MPYYLVHPIAAPMVELLVSHAISHVYLKCGLHDEARMSNKAAYSTRRRHSRMLLHAALFFRF